MKYCCFMMDNNDVIFEKVVFFLSKCICCPYSYLLMAHFVYLIFLITLHLYPLFAAALGCRNVVYIL